MSKFHLQDHFSWARPEGVLMVGGTEQSDTEPITAELVSWDGTSTEEKFNLSLIHRSGCMVEDDNTFILIGGWQGFHKPEASHLSVTRYDMNGFIEHLPELRRERDGSGCSYFYAGYGKVMIVIVSMLSLLKHFLLKKWPHTFN